jgi:hypothetical protein
VAARRHRCRARPVPGQAAPGGEHGHGAAGWAGRWWAPVGPPRLYGACPSPSV